MYVLMYVSGVAVSHAHSANLHVRKQQLYFLFCCYCTDISARKAHVFSKVYYLL